MPTYTLTQLGTQALRDIGCLRAGQKTSADVLAELLDIANQRLDLWTIDKRIIYARPASIFTLIAGLQTYKIGPGQVAPDFAAVRPTGIADANIILNTVSPVVRTQVEIVQQDRWAAIRVRDIPFAIPLKLYYDGDFANLTGYASINLWPGPQSSYQLELFTSTVAPFTSFADLTTAYSFPPGYAFLVRKQLAMDAVPSMDIGAKTYRLQRPRAPMVALVRQQLGEALETIASDNAEIRTMQGDPAYTGVRAGGFNYAIGE